MRKDKEATGAPRREFLKLAGLGSLAGAAALAGGGREAEAAAVEETGKAGYRETAHVKKVYELSRF